MVKSAKQNLLITHFTTDGLFFFTRGYFALKQVTVFMCISMISRNTDHYLFLS